MDILQSVTSGFSLAEGLSLYKLLAIFVLGMIIYSMFIFKFYRFVARRDIFKNTNKDKEGVEKKRFF